jgi:hypothetical protein
VSAEPSKKSGRLPVHIPLRTTSGLHSWFEDLRIPTSKSNALSQG